MQGARVVCVCVCVCALNTYMLVVTQSMPGALEARTGTMRAVGQVPTRPAPLFRHMPEYVSSTFLCLVNV